MAGSVRKEGSTWGYVFDIGKDTNGKRKQKRKRGFKTKKEAQVALNDAMNSYYKGTFIEPSVTPYKDYLHEWFETKRATIGIQTANAYEFQLNSKIIPSLGGYPLSKLSTLHIQTFINNLNRKGYSWATIKKAYEVICSSLSYAVDFDLVSKNVALKAKLPKRSEREMNVWNEDELNLFLQKAEEDPMYIVFFLALTTGMRQGEILGLRWKDICFNKGIISIKQTLSHDGKQILKGAKTQAGLRNIQLPTSVIEKLKSLNRAIEKRKKELGPIYEDQDLVNCTNHGTPFNPANVRRTFNRLIEVADVPKIRFHDLRHTHATLLLSKGVNVKVISERLGHSNIKVTLDTYSHVLPTMQEDAVRKLDAIIQ